MGWELGGKFDILIYKKERDPFAAFSTHHDHS
jgi:hypothetical protein